jgi:hypothetical protein
MFDSRYKVQGFFREKNVRDTFHLVQENIWSAKFQ